MRLAGLNEKLAALGYEVDDLGNVIVEQPESLPIGKPDARYLPQIAHTYAFVAITSGAPVHDSGEPGQLSPRYLPRMRPASTTRGKTIR